MNSVIHMPPRIGKHFSWRRRASITITAEYSPTPNWCRRVVYTALADRRCPMCSLAIGRQPSTEGPSRDVRTWLARPSRDHQSVKDWSSAGLQPQKRAKNHRLLNFILYSESWVLKTKESAEKFSSAVVLGLELNLQLFFPIKAKTCQEPPRC
jgi:hypothetical protein